MLLQEEPHFVPKGEFSVLAKGPPHIQVPSLARSLKQQTFPHLSTNSESTSSFSLHRPTSREDLFVHETIIP